MIIKSLNISGLDEKMDPTWDKIEKSLTRLNGKDVSYLIISSDSYDFIQCAGNQDKLTVEYRLTDKNKFKHFVIGKGKAKSAFKTVWATIECNVGPIRVHTNEILDISDATDIFKSYFWDGIIPDYYKKRDVTRQFK